jgi:hypothetical protein
LRAARGERRPRLARRGVEFHAAHEPSDRYGLVRWERESTIALGQDRCKAVE